MAASIARWLAPLSLIVAAGCSGTSGDPATDTAQAGGSPVATVYPTPVLRTIELRAGEHTLRVEVAAPGAETGRGLSGRDALAPDAGMLFDLDGPRVPTFWMKGMRFPLDMVWVGEDGRVVGVEADIPPPAPGALDHMLPRYSPAEPVDYVLELNAGAAARLGITAGTQLQFDVGD